MKQKVTHWNRTKQKMEKKEKEGREKSQETEIHLLHGNHD